MVLLVLVVTVEIGAAKRGKGRGKKARKFGGRGITKNFKSEASRAYYNHNGVSNGVCWSGATLWFSFYVRATLLSSWATLTIYRVVLK